VRERQIAADAGQHSRFDLAKGTRSAGVDVTARPETPVAQLEEEVEREIDLLHRKGVSDESEVRRASA
jgi:hypothetical protein